MGKKSGQSKAMQQELFGDLGKMNAEVKAALKLLDSEKADAIIGDAPDEHKALIQGCKALCGLAWATYKLHGLKQKDATLKLAANNLLLHLTLVHYAYALGIEQGLLRAVEAAGGP